MRTKKPSLVAAGAVLALALGSQTAAWAGSDGPKSGGQNEGIKVHGEWTIDILNPDGTLASHHEIRNALQPGGAAKLARFLGRVNSPSLWELLLYSTGTTPNCSPSGVPCILSEVSGYGNGSLSVSVPASGPNQDKLVLSGSFTSADARSIFRVFSGVSLCPPNSPGCVTSGDAQFSMKDFTPIPVQAGQIVQVTVVFSFS